MRVLELDPAARRRSARLRCLLFASQHCGFGIFDVELTRAEHGFPLGDRALPRDQRVEPLLNFCLAPRKQLFRVGAVGFLRPLGAAHASPPSVVAPCIELIQLPRAPLYLELPARDIRRALAQRTLQVFDLELSLDVLTLASLGELPGKAEHLIAIGILLRLLPGCLPADRFPRVPPRPHVPERSALRGWFGLSEQGKTSGAENDQRRSDAHQTCQREERKAVRGAKGEGDVEGARGEDRELARRLESRREEVALGLIPLVVQPGRDDGPEEGGGTQRRQSHRPQELRKY